MPKCFLKTLLIPFFSLLFALPGSAQNAGKYERLISKIDSLTHIGLPKSALLEVDKLDKLARLERNTSQQVKAVIYRINFQSYLEEQALEAIINRLKLDILKSAYPVKPVLQSLLAELYFNYYQQHRYQIMQRTALDKPDADFTRWDLQTLINEVSFLYRLSLKDAALAKNTPIAVLNDVLVGDTTTRIFRPTLYDFLAQRALDFYLTEDPDLLTPKMPFSLKSAELFADNSTFANTQITTADTLSVSYQGIKLLKEITAVHLSGKDINPLADINLKRLEHVFRKSVHPDKDSLYLRGLENLVLDFSSSSVAGDAAVKIAQYYQQKDSLTISKIYLDKVIQSHPNTFASQNARNLIEQLEDKSLELTVENVNIPASPVLVLVKYKNLNRLNYKLYKLNDTQLKLIQKLGNQDSRWQNETIHPTDSLLIYLAKQKAVNDGEINLVETNDFKIHHSEFALQPLSPGNYLLLSKNPENDDKSITNIVQFKVSNLAFSSRITPAGFLDIRTLNRKTGEPLSNVLVTINETRYVERKAKEFVLAKGLSNTKGVFLFSNEKSNGKQLSISLELADDSYKQNYIYMHGVLYNNDLEKDIDRTVLFTDRQIYRPGQTVYLKGIQLIQSGKKSRIATNKFIEASFSDANGKKVGSLSFTTNEFGTFSGTFIIPQSALNGHFFLNTLNGSIAIRVEEYKRPTFQIGLDAVKESYKLADSVTLTGRVTAFSGYGISNGKVAYRITRQRTNVRDYRSGYRNNPTEIQSDTINTNNTGEFSIKFKALAEGGANQKDVVFNYLITADVTDGSGETRSTNTTVVVGNKPFVISFPLPEKLLANYDNFLFKPFELNKNKNAPLFLIDGVPQDGLSPLKSLNPSDIVKMDIEKDAAAIAKYSQRAANGVVLITTNGVNLKDKTDSGRINTFQIPVQLSNLNNQKLDGTLKVRIYLLKSAEQVYVKRLWNRPDKHLLSKVDFRRLFPYYEYQDESDYKNLARNKLVSEFDLKVSPNTANYVDLSVLKKQVGGTYEIEVFARNAKGDTSTSKFYTSLITEPSVPDKLDDWVMPVKTTIFPGEDAEFFIGLGKMTHILMETYDGTKLLSSEWIKGTGKQQHIKVPVNLGSTEFAVQFLAVFQNRMLSRYQKIALRKFDETLDIRFLTFRDKLEPGAKEQWKLQIKSADNQAAEMVASLYDSSLDDVAEPQSWLNLFNSHDYHPHYFEWRKNDVTPITSRPFDFFNSYFTPLERSYETLDMLGFNPFAGYSEFLGRSTQRRKWALSDQKLKEEYTKNAALIKNGFDVSGIVTDKRNAVLPNVKVQIKGTNISTLTNSKGYFKLKVPQKAVLKLSLIGFASQQVTVSARTLNIMLTSDLMLDDVVTIGYGTQKSRNIAGSPVQELREEVLTTSQSDGRTAGDANVQIRGTNSVVEDSGVYNSASMDLNSGVKSKANIIRKNFNETAFFYPQLRTNAKGEILIDFTIPEALTSWRFKGFAHTKSLQTGYIEKTIVTQKSLMISANMPRFFRQGDSITISARLANLTNKKLNGKVELQLFNALTMKPVNLLADSLIAKQDFSLASATNKAVSFSLLIPKGLDAIAYRLTADAGSFQDGEENIIPVLPNSMLVTESVPIMVRAGQTKTFTLDKLKNANSTTLKNKVLTLEYTQNPVWYAVQSLPYLMEVTHESSEHVFSRFFANTLAGNLVNRLPQIKKVLDQWKMTNSDQLLSNLDKNPELKSVLLEETPWLQNAVSEAEQKKRIALLFDLNKMSNELEADILKLSKIQRHDGGFPWFAGSNYSDRYITQHILGGLGQLNKLTGLKSGNAAKEISARALTYLDNEIIRDYKSVSKTEKKSGKEVNPISLITLHALYVRSYYPAQKTSPQVKAALNYFMPKIASAWKYRSVYEQGLMAFILKRNNQPEAAKALIRSLKETGQRSEELGMYWAKNQTGYYWYQSPIETQALLIELFSEIGNEQASVEEMKIWLLRNKQTNNWQTTKATALACHALLLQGNSVLNVEQGTEISLGDKSLAVLKPEVKADAGTGYIKTVWREEQITPELATVQIKNTGKSISWGALHWQYLEELNKISSAETQLKLERKYFIQKQTDAGPILIEINGATLPKTGDLLKVVVYLNADRDYEYVHLKDMRPSGTEPVDILSGYKYQDRMYYYQVTKDVATNFFINYLPKGKYVFEYNLRVAQPGNYSTGISSIQCLYAPEFNAHSEGRRMMIK